MRQGVIYTLTHLALYADFSLSQKVIGKCVKVIGEWSVWLAYDWKVIESDLGMIGVWLANDLKSDWRVIGKLFRWLESDWEVTFMKKWENLKWLWFWLKMSDKLNWWKQYFQKYVFIIRNFWLGTPHEYGAVSVYSECLVWVSVTVSGEWKWVIN